MQFWVGNPITMQDITGHASAYRSNSFMNYSSIVEKRTFGMKYDLYKQKKHDKKKHDKKKHNKKKHNKKCT